MNFKAIYFLVIIMVFASCDDDNVNLSSISDAASNGAVIELVSTTGLDGVIASNTSVNREGLQVSDARLEEIGNGGLSGLPIRERSTAVIKYLSDKSKGSFPIIGVGGIHSAQDALDKLDAGASLVQLYTGFVYEGPGLIKDINKALLARA